MKKLFGVTVAMVTPFDSDDQIDRGALTKLTEMLVQKGVNCLYPCGTTGEMLHMSVEERKLVAQIIIKTVAGRIPVFIHVGTMRVPTTLELARHAQNIGADGIGVVTPPFFTCTDHELQHYFVTVANSISPNFPVYLYSIPQCASNHLNVEVVRKIEQQCSNVIGIKYSFADMNTTLAYLNMKEGFSVLHGYDKLFHGLLQSGCDGTVSGCACVFPEPFVNTYHAFKMGDRNKARFWQKASVEFSDALQSGSNTAIFKSALTLRGLDAGHMRLPQLDLNDTENNELKEKLESLCNKYGILFVLN